MAPSSYAQQPEPATPDRPQMPASYGVDPAAEAGLLPWSAVRDRLVSARNYWVGTTRPDGRPHAAPVWGLWLDEVFLFATDVASRKGRNLAANAAIVVHLESGDEVVIVEGRAEVVADPAVLARFADAYEAKYQFRPAVDGPAPGVYRVRPTVVYAWFESEFPGSASRWRFGRA